MNNQIEVASNHPNNCLPHNICSNPHSYHSNTLSLSDHSEIRLFKSQIELDNFSLIHSFSPKLMTTIFLIAQGSLGRQQTLIGIH